MRRRWLKYTLLGLATLVVLAVAVAVWLLGTGGGLRFALNRAVIMLDDRLQYERAEGSLLGGLRLDGVRYADPAIGDYRAARIEIAPRSRQLLSGELLLTAVTVTGVEIVLPPPSDEPPPPREEPFSLPTIVAPIGLRVQQLLVQGLDVRQHDLTPVIALDRIEGAAWWRGARIALERLDVRAPEGHLEARADIDTAADWAGDADLRFQWQLPEQPRPLAGHLHLAGPQRRPELALDLVQPSPARIELVWDESPADERQWQLVARSDGFDLAGVLADPPVRLLRFDLEGRGDLESARLSGQVEVDGYALLLEALDGRLVESTLELERLAVAERDAPGRLEASGRFDLDADAPTGSLRASWQRINPPLPAPFDRLDVHGELEASGTLAHLAAELDARATLDGQPVRLHLLAEGDPQQQVRIQPLRLETGNGHVELDGDLRLQPDLAWQADIRARGFDPGLLAPDWPGRVELDASSRGTFADGRLSARLDIARLGGQLKQRPLAGEGTIELAGVDQVQADLDLRLGGNRIRLDGRLGEQSDADVRFLLADPGLLLDGASGSAEGAFAVRGSWPALTVIGQAQASDLRLDELRLGTLNVDLDVRTDLAARSHIAVQAGELQLAGQTIDTIRLNGAGDASGHELTLEVGSDRGNADLTLAGRLDLDAGQWSGRIEGLNLAAPELPEPLALREPAALSLSQTSAELARTCLDGGSSHLCLDGAWSQDGGGNVGVAIARLPLTWLAALADENQLMQVDGELSLDGRFQIDAGGRLSGEARLEGTPGQVRLYGEEDALVTWTRLDTTLSLDGEQRLVDAVIELSPAGRIDARIETRPDPDSGNVLAGTIELFLPELGVIELLTPELVNPSGELQGRIQLGGSLQAPRIDGRVDLTGFAVDVPTAGLRLRDSRLAVVSRDGGRLDIDGLINTRDDSGLLVQGWIGLPDAATPFSMDVRVTGDNVLAADIPAARVFISPDLHIEADAERLNITGQVQVPQARILPESFQGGPVRSSPDIHIVDPEAAAEAAQEAQAGLPLYASVVVVLGDRVTIEGYGLKGSLSGRLEVDERPGRPTTGRGEIVVAGDYQAYGQDLAIERGRLIFAGSPLDNPLLDIRAIRRIETVTAGLAVTGNVERPILEVYSVPAMDQAEALSYLVLGRPLRQATSSADQNVLGTAATAVTTAGGDLLAKSLGARLGLDDVGVGTSRDLGAGALTVGKYLSPRLYLGYGRSLFDGGQLVSLRYRLTERFELEAQSGTRENKAGINYRYER